MQLDVAAGTRLTVVAGDRRTSVQTLEPVDAGVPADVAVIASAEALDLPEGHVDLATGAGPVTVSARVLRHAGAVVLRLGAVLRRQQRRGAVRGAVELDVLIAVPDGPGAHRRVVRGRTVNVSAGGMLVELAACGEVADGPGLLDAEITIGPDEHVPAVLSVVAVDGRDLHALIVDVAPRVRRELARMAAGQDQSGARQVGPSHPKARSLAPVVPLLGPGPASDRA